MTAAAPVGVDATAEPSGARRVGARGTRALVVVFTVMNLAYLSAAAYAQRTAGSISRAALEIHDGVDGDVEGLVRLQNDWRELEVTVADQVGEMERHGTADLPAIDALRDRAARGWRAYEASTRRAGRPGFDRAFETEVASLDAGVAEVRGRLARGEGDAARRGLRARLRPASAAVARELLRHVDHDARRGDALADQIVAVRRRSLRVAALVDAATLALALVLAARVTRAIRRDQTALATQRAAAEARADELDLFGTRVAHDLYNPLTAAGLALDLVERDAQEPALRERLRHARSGIDRAAAIVSGLLAFARSGARPEPGASVDLDEVVHGVLDTLRPIADAAHVTLRDDVPPGVRVACSSGVLASLVGNLVSNAIQYMGERPEREVCVRAEATPSGVTLWVQDTGPGLPEALGARVFEPYVRGPNARAAGLGIGLATVKRIATAHGGSVRAERWARGGRVRVELPRATAVSASAPIQPVQGAT